MLTPVPDHPMRPDHPIRLEPATRRWRACFNGHVFADTDDALVVREADLPPVVYFPRRDVAMEYMGRTDRQTHCPYKGDASYYTLTMDGDVAENVAWSYEAPADEVAQLAGMIAFYADRVEVYAVTDPRIYSRHVTRSFEGEATSDTDRVAIDEVIQHTDAGDGTSQREHWPANVETPGQPEGGVR